MALPQNEIVFKGHVGKFGQKEGEGEEIYKGRQGYEYYIGNFKRDAYNGHANYFANSIKRGLWAYDGNFCANSLEGYGAMSYGDATFFAGLFKNDKPFGPGVLTYPNGSQDVGIWFGSQLYRLSTTVGQIEKLTNSTKDKIQVAKFKKLIAINEAPRDIASAIIGSFGRTDNAKIDPSHLYSRFCKDPKSYFYDHNYFNDELDDLVETEKSLEIEEVSEVQQSDTNTLATKFVNTSIVELKEMKSDDEVDYNDYYGGYSPTRSKFKEEVYILSWNNTPNVINIMKHSFKHRKQEEISDFDIGDILCGRRKLFRMRGPKETASIKVLEASGCNDVLTILKQLKKHGLNVNVMDNKGNSMILRAAANDALEVMQMLHLLGADIDTVNDEGFSALTHTLTRYIAIKYDVHNWSRGFLQRKQRNEEAEDLEEQWLDECMLSNYSIIQGSITSILQRTYSKVKTNKKFGSVSLTSKGSKSPRIFSPEPSIPYVFELSPEPRISKITRGSMDISEEAKSEKKKRLEIIKNTACYLLDIGADIYVSVTPAPIMILAIFSGCLPIVEKLLKCGADTNEFYNINNGQLTALHIIAQARPLPSYPAMVNMFLRYGADPNLRTSVNYNMPEWEHLLELVKLSHSTIQGLTPLHIIALRSDATYVTNKEYLEQICCLLSWFSNHNEHFLGLSPLGLAISKGNNNIVSKMLDCAKIDVNATFDTFWGNPLCTYLRCHASKDEPTTLDILRTLILKGVDPLEASIIVRGKGNALNFMAQMKDKRRRTHSKSTIYGFPQVSNDFNMRYHEQILMELAKLNLRKYIRGVLIRLHLKFMDRMDSEKASFLRHIHLLSKRRHPSIISESIISTIEDKSDYGYYEVCERTKDWMNNIDECKNIMEKTIESMGDSYGPVKAIRLMALLPNLTIVPKMSELKNLKITKFLNGKCLPDLRNCPIGNNKEVSFQSLTESEIEENEEENLKWINHFVKMHNKDAFVYPELEKKRAKYIVCYKCLKQSDFAQACPVCRLVYFCSMKCNLADSQRPDPYHRCGLVFWNLKKDQYFAFERLDSDIKKSTKSISKKVVLSKKGSPKISTPTPKHVTEQEEHWSSLTEITSELSSDDYEYGRKGRGKSRKDKQKSFLLQISKNIKDMKKLKKKKDLSKSRLKKGKGKGKGKKGKKLKLASSFRHFRLRTGYASLTDEATEADLLGLGEKDRKWAQMSTRPSVHVAARLLERESYILEHNRLETLRLKEAQDAIDTKLLGEVAPPEEFWEKTDERGEGKKHHTSQDRFIAFLKMLEAKFGSFDLEKYLPFILFVDGVMYHKPYDDKYKENYSFN